MQQTTSVLINGQANNHIQASDRGFQFGDGCFTTIAAINGELQLWPLHWQRIQLTCERLQIPLAAEWQHLLKQEAEQLLKSFFAETPNTEAHTRAVVKIVISRGSGGRGYTPNVNSVPNRVVQVSPMPNHYQEWRETGIRLAWAELQLAEQPALAGLKTLNRLEQVLLKQELVKTTADDLLVCSSSGLVCETIVGNIFWRANHQWFTPKLNKAGIAGVVRQEVLVKNPEVQLVDALPQQLLTADRVMVCNSLMGLVPVKSIAARPLVVTDAAHSRDANAHYLSDRDFIVDTYPLQLSTKLE